MVYIGSQGRRGAAADRQSRQAVRRQRRVAQRLCRPRADLQAPQLGASVFSLNQIYERVGGFHHHWRLAGRPPLYFASWDIYHCFDQINQDKLVEVLEGLAFVEDDYLIAKLSASFPSNGRVRSKPFRLALPGDGEYPVFPEAVRRGGR